MNWLAVKSVEELKSLGKFKIVKDEIEKAAGGAVNAKVKGWNKLYLNILDFQQLLSRLGLVQIEKSNETGINSKSSNSESSTYFNSKAAEYIFYLLELDGDARLKKLKITKTHYSNKQMAKIWRNEIIKVIHSDKCDHPKADAATSKLTELYKGMVGDE